MQATMVQEMFGEACPASAPFFGYMGASAALIFASEFSPFFYSLPFACLHEGPSHMCRILADSSSTRSRASGELNSGRLRESGMSLEMCLL